MEEETKVSRFAYFKKADVEESYLTNCLLIQRDDQQGTMFEAITTPGKVCARLDRYAIIPIEKYYALFPEKLSPTTPLDPSL